MCFIQGRSLQERRMAVGASIPLPLSFTGGFSSEGTAEAAEDQTRTRERVRASANLGKRAGFSPPFNTGFYIISRPLWRLVPGG
jgi:hypothetical protein